MTKPIFPVAETEKDLLEEDERCYRDPIRRRKILWSSDRWSTGPTTNYYADTLSLLEIDDGLFALELKVDGTVTRMQIKNISKYMG